MGLNWIYWCCNHKEKWQIKGDKESVFKLDPGDALLNYCIGKALFTCPHDHAQTHTYSQTHSQIHSLSLHTQTEKAKTQRPSLVWKHSWRGEPWAAKIRHWQVCLIKALAHFNKHRKTMKHRIMKSRCGAGERERVPFLCSFSLASNATRTPPWCAQTTHFRYDCVFIFQKLSAVTFFFLYRYICAGYV